MLFPTVTFATFFIVVYIVHLVLQPRERAWKVAMLAASYLFYGWWDWRFCGLLAASTALNWLFGQGIRASHGRCRRLLMAMAVAANLGALSLFKYYGFFVEAVSNTLGSAAALPALDLVLPVGISFFTFQALSYVIDTGRGQVESCSLLDFAVYLSFFPHLVAGPIVRASELLPQLAQIPQRRPIDVSAAAWLIGRGLFKKVVVATYLAETVVGPAFAAPALASKTQLLAAMYGYAIQIYADFSGYTDIAIGIAALLGIDFPVNFDRPYRARSIQDFWRRWHMTLSRWLRDYLYIPLGGSRGSSAATYRNLMVTMVLGGLWHGAAWTFIIWGAIQGVALGLERFVTSRRAGLPESVTPAGPARAVRQGAKWFITFHVVVLAWVLFRAQNIELAWQFFIGLATAPLAGPVNLAAVALIGAALATQLAPDDVGPRLYRVYAGLDPTLQSALVGVWLFFIVALGPEGVAPFIYFQF